MSLKKKKNSQAYILYHLFKILFIFKLIMLCYNFYFEKVQKNYVILEFVWGFRICYDQNIL